VTAFILVGKSCSVKILYFDILLNVLFQRLLSAFSEVAVVIPKIGVFLIDRAI